MDVKVKFEFFKGILVSWGQNSLFPIDFSRGPYYSAALLTLKSGSEVTRGH